MIFIVVAKRYIFYFYVLLQVTRTARYVSCRARKCFCCYNRRHVVRFSRPTFINSLHVLYVAAFYWWMDICFSMTQDDVSEVEEIVSESPKYTDDFHSDGDDTLRDTESIAEDVSEGMPKLN